MANTLEETLLSAFATVISLETFPLNGVKSNCSFCNLTHTYHQHQKMKPLQIPGSPGPCQELELYSEASNFL